MPTKTQPELKRPKQRPSHLCPKYMGANSGPICNQAERDAASSKLGGKPEITRFKGLGEISPNEFKQFIGKEMRVGQVDYAPKVDSQQILSFYIGKNTLERKDCIMENLVVTVDE